MGIITTNCHIKLFKPGTAGVRIPLGAPLFSPFLFRDFQGHPYCSFELVRLPVLPAASPEFQLVVGQFEIAEIVLAQMKTLVESLSIWLWGDSNCCPFSGCCLATMLRTASGFALALGRNRALHLVVFPLLVTSLAR